MSIRSDLIDVLAQREFETAALNKYLYAGYTWEEVSPNVKDGLRIQVAGTVDILMPTIAQYVGEKIPA